MEENKQPILILGVGNTIQADDGIGVYVIKEMKKISLPQGMELLDGGTAGPDLIKHIEGRQKLIVIDAVKGGKEPGTIFRFTPEDIGLLPGRIDSLHQVGLFELLEMAELTGAKPQEVVIFGIEPQSIEWGLEPTKILKEKVPRVIEMIIEEVSTKEGGSIWQKT